jgi:hypothetical protein
MYQASRTYSELSESLLREVVETEVRMMTPAMSAHLDLTSTPPFLTILYLYSPRALVHNMEGVITEIASLPLRADVNLECGEDKATLQATLDTIATQVGSRNLHWSRKIENPSDFK